MAQTSFNNTMKNKMLDEWRNQVLEIYAIDNLGNDITDGVITFQEASNGKAELDNVSKLTIPTDTTVNQIEVRVGLLVQLSFNVGVDVYFEHGGDLIITQCDVEIGN